MHPPTRSSRSRLGALLILPMLALALAGCRQDTAGIADADEPSAFKESLDGVWTLTLNPEVVQQGGQSMNVSLSLESRKTNTTSGTLDGTLASTPITDGRYMTGGELTAPAIEFTSGQVTIPTGPDDADGGRVVPGPLTWKGTLVDDDTLTGTVSGDTGDMGSNSRWTATKNAQGL